MDYEIDFDAEADVVVKTSGRANRDDIRRFLNEDRLRWAFPVRLVPPQRPLGARLQRAHAGGHQRHQRPRQQPGREARFRAGRGGRAQRVRVWSGAHGPDARHDRRSRPDLLLARRRGRVARQGRRQAKSSTTDARQSRAARRHRVGESACTPSGLGVALGKGGLSERNRLAALLTPIPPGRGSKRPSLLLPTCRHRSAADKLRLHCDTLHLPSDKRCVMVSAFHGRPVSGEPRQG